MRRILLGIVLALCVPATASAGNRVAAFYYPWYGTVARDGAYQHWGQNGHTPPNDIASSYYPLQGVYSSTDKIVVGQQMDEIKSAGIDEIAVSWWGRGSAEDKGLGGLGAGGRTRKSAVRVHLEPAGN